MTMDLFTTQQDVFNYLTAQADFAIYDTSLPGAQDEPLSSNGYMVGYAVMRFNDAVKIPQKGAFGGARWDEMYSLIDVLCVGATPDEAREVAYGIDGVADLLTGYTPVDAGQLTRQSGGQVFVVGDGTATTPTRYIARVSFRMVVNTTIDE